MQFFYAMNLAASAVLLFWPQWFSRRYLGLTGFDPLVMAMVLGLPIQAMRLYGGPLFLIDDGLLDEAYQFALLMGNVQIVAQTMGLVAFFCLFKAMKADRWLPGRSIALNRRSLRRGANLFLLLFGITFYLLASAEFGVLNWLQNPRIGYQLYRTGQGHWYALAITSLSASFLLRFLSAPRPKPFLAWAGLYLILAMMLGSKAVVLEFFTSVLIFLWFVRWKHLAKMFLIGTPIIFFVMVLNLYLALLDGFELVSIFLYFDYYKNAADYYREVLSGNIELYHGEVTLTSLWAYVPRALFPDKPVVYGVLLINEIFYPGQAELTNTPDFGGAVEQYADFGFIGVIVFNLFSLSSVSLALLTYLIFKRPRIDVERATLATVGLMFVQFAPMFGHYFPGALFIAILAAALILTMAVRTSRRRQRNIQFLTLQAYEKPAAASRHLD